VRARARARARAYVCVRASAADYGEDECQEYAPYIKMPRI